MEMIVMVVSTTGRHLFQFYGVLYFVAFTYLQKMPRAA